MDRLDFKLALGKLINQLSLENESNTPDYILAEYLTRCLETWNDCTAMRQNHHVPPKRSLAELEGQLDAATGWLETIVSENWDLRQYDTPENNRIYRVEASFYNPQRTFNENVKQNVLAEGIMPALSLFIHEHADKRELKIWAIKYVCSIDIGLTTPDKKG